MKLIKTYSKCNFENQKLHILSYEDFVNIEYVILADLKKSIITLDQLFIKRRG